MTTTNVIVVTASSTVRRGTKASLPVGAVTSCPEGKCANASPIDKASNPPPGFSSWLEYVAQTFDYRMAAAPFLFERDPVNTQRLIAEAVHEEWHDLKARDERNSQSQ